MVEIINDSSPPEMCFRTISKNHLTMVADSNMFDPVYVKIRNKYNDVLFVLTFFLHNRGKSGWILHRFALVAKAGQMATFLSLSSVNRNLR
jgi:hypothetical protein